MRIQNKIQACLIAVLVSSTACVHTPPPDPLPSWNSGSVKDGIEQFVARVTTEGGADFVPVSARIATFDNDGTLWAEQPIYVQFAFAIDRIKALAPSHPEWSHEQPFQAVIEGNMAEFAAGGAPALMKVIAASHTGMTSDEFETIVKDWIEKARDERFHRPYTDRVYKPMLDLLAYLRANGFKTFIVSGGGVDFMRPWTERVYGIPPEQVVGSMIKLKFSANNGAPVLLREPEIDLIDDRDGKPVGIEKFIGRRPIFAAGNSDGDLEMLQWTAAGKRPNFELLVHHTDAAREWSYDRTSPVGRLDKALDEAVARKWSVVDMKQDWKVIFPFDK